MTHEFIPSHSLFGQALVKIGTEREDFVTLSQRIGRKTGGIWPTTFTGAIKGSQSTATWLFLRSKATIDQADDLLAILRDVLLTVNLDNQARFKQMVLEKKASTEAGLIPDGHRLVNTRLRAHFDQAGWAAEQMGGVSHLFFLRQLAHDVDEDWPGVLEKLEQVRYSLINRDNVLANVTLDKANWSDFQHALTGFLGRLPSAPVDHVLWTPEKQPSFEGLTIPAQVNYVGKGANLYQVGYQIHGSASVVINHLRNTWIWERIRMQGGAYGGLCVFDHRSGVLTYLSYRDPNLLETLDSFDQASGFLRQLNLSAGELTKSIIGAIGQMDAYQLPDAKGYSSMVHHLTEDTDQARQQRRNEVLSTTAADFKAFAEVLEWVNKEGCVVVMGSQKALESANAVRGDWLEIKKAL